MPLSIVGRRYIYMYSVSVAVTGFGASLGPILTICLGRYSSQYYTAHMFYAQYLSRLMCTCPCEVKAQELRIRLIAMLGQSLI